MGTKRAYSIDTGNHTPVPVRRNDIQALASCHESSKLNGLIFLPGSSLRQTIESSPKIRSLTLY